VHILHGWPSPILHDSPTAINVSDASTCFQQLPFHLYLRLHVACISYTFLLLRSFPSSPRQSRWSNLRRLKLAVSLFPFPSVASTPPNLRQWFRTLLGTKLSSYHPTFQVVPVINQTSRKIRRGIAAFEKNTGKTHSLATGFKTSKSGKRSDGVIPTMMIPVFNQNATLWYGTISVGTPPVDYTGIALSFGRVFPSDTVESSVL